MSARLRMSSPPHNGGCSVPPSPPYDGGGSLFITLHPSSIILRQYVVEHAVYLIMSRRGEVGGVLLLTSSPLCNGVCIILLIFVLEDSVYSVVGRRQGVLLLSSSCWSIIKRSYYSSSDVSFVH